MSKIVLNHNNKEYVLEYNRQSVKMIEGQGFVLEEIATKPVTMIPLLFQGAFLKNCKGVKRAVIDEIYEGIGNKLDLIQVLGEMYAETISSLTDDTEEGNVTWELMK
jgi:hypothetical protein